MSVSLAGVSMEDIYVEHRDQIRRYVTRRVIEHEAVDDLVQDTFLRAIALADQYTGDVDGIRPWLTGRAACAVGDYLLDRRAYLRAAHEVHRALGLETAAPLRRLIRASDREPAAPPLFPARRAFRSDLSVALSRLPEKQRRTLQFRFLEGLTMDVTAALMGCTQITVVRRQRRALEALRSAGVLR